MFWWWECSLYVLKSYCIWILDVMLLSRFEILLVWFQIHFEYVLKIYRQVKTKEPEPEPAQSDVTKERNEYRCTESWLKSAAAFQTIWMIRCSWITLIGHWREQGERETTETHPRFCLQFLLQLSDKRLNFVMKYEWNCTSRTFSALSLIGWCAVTWSDDALWLTVSTNNYNK